MASDKQVLANIENAKKSTGPRTEAGKRRSSLNALRHGLTGQVVILPHEDIAAHKAFTDELIATFEPDNANERQLAYLYADLHWKINRAGAIEDNMFGLGIMEEIAGNLNLEHPEAHNAASNAKTFRSDSMEFSRICMYRQRMINQAEKIHKQLKQVQAERKSNQRRQMDEAIRLMRYHEMQEEAFDPRKNGFDLSVDQLKEHIRRETVDSQASLAENVDYNRVLYLKELARAA